MRPCAAARICTFLGLISFYYPYFEKKIVVMEGGGKGAGGVQISFSRKIPIILQFCHVIANIFNKEEYVFISHKVR